MSIRNVNLQLERSPVGLSLRKIAQRILYSDFTDGAGTAGTLTMTPTLPAGAFFVGTKVEVVTAFTGGTNTTAVLIAGKTSGQDEFTDGTNVSIYTAAKVGQEGEAPLEYLSSATTVYLQATVSADWTTISAGEMFVELFYLSTEPEIVESYPNKWRKAS